MIRLDPQHDRRLAVVGSSGAGKSTLAQRLADDIDATSTSLDNLNFGSNWTPRPTEDFRADIDRVTAGERWVIDGNYRLVRDLIWPRATTLVWLDYPLTTCFGRLLKRTLRRAWTRETVCNGNQESLRISFTSHDSVLLYLLKSHRRNREETAADLAKPEHAHLRVIHLKKPADCQLSQTLSAERRA